MEQSNTLYHFYMVHYELTAAAAGKVVFLSGATDTLEEISIVTFGFFCIKSFTLSNVAMFGGMIILVRFEQYSRKRFPMVVTCEKLLKSKLVRLEQPARKVFPIDVTCEKPLKFKLVRFEQPARKPFPMVVTCENELRSKLVSFEQ